MNQLSKSSLLASVAFAAGVGGTLLWQGSESSNLAPQVSPQLSQSAAEPNATTALTLSGTAEAQPLAAQNAIHEDAEPQTQEQLKQALYETQQKLAKATQQLAAVENSRAGLAEVAEETEEQKAQRINPAMSNPQYFQMLRNMTEKNQSKLLGQLNLDEVQQAALTRLLQNKTDADLKSIEEYYEIKHSDLSKKEKTKLMAQNYRERVMSDNATHQDISNLLTQEQQEEYLAIEKKQAELGYKNQLQRTEETLFAAIPELDRYQKEQIQAALGQQQPSYDEVKLGVYGTSYSPRNVPKLDKHELLNQLKGVLTEEQLEVAADKLEVKKKAA